MADHRGQPQALALRCRPDMVRAKPILEQGIVEIRQFVRMYGHNRVADMKAVQQGVVDDGLEKEWRSLCGEIAIG